MRSSSSSNRLEPRRAPQWWCLSVLLALFVVAPVAAQTGTVRGTVVDATTRQPLSGAQVFIPNAGVGTITNAAGAFLLVNAPAGQQTVRAQLIGYASGNQTVTVEPGQTATATFELNPSAVALDEVVVTGTGVATERRKLGNTVATIDATNLEDKPINTFSEALAGREPGVVAMPSGGLTGEGTRIRIRGTSSLSQSNEPIVYVNGVRVDNAGGRGYIGTGGGALPSRLDDIDPNSIERIEILKGAAAATLYGTEASAGVIQIFTKRGTAGDTRWTAEIEQGMLGYPEDKFEPNAGFVTTQAEADRLSQFFGMNIQPYQPFTRDFITPLFGTGYTSSYSASVTGGSSAVTYFASGRYAYEDGPIDPEFDVLATDVATKAQGNISVSVFPHEDVTLRVTSMYTESESNTLNNNNNIYAPVTLAIFGQPQRARCTTPGDPVDDPIPGTGECEVSGNPFGQAAFGTVREVFQRTIEQDAQHYNGSASISYRPMEGVSLDGTFGVDVTNQRDLLYYPFGYNLDKMTLNNTAGFRGVSDRNFQQLSMDAKASWETDFSESINSQFVFGAQGFIDEEQFLYSEGADFPGPGFEITGAGARDNVAEFFTSVVNAGFFAQEQIGWNDWVFVTAGARYDYNSAFGESAGGALYPKASISVIPSSLATWASPMGISTLRFRAAIGQAGKQPDAFAKLTTFSAISAEEGPGVAPDNLGNQDLKPEISTEWEVGTEVGLFEDRLALEGTYWNRSVTDALISRQFPLSGGFLDRQLDNIGELAAQGVEIGARGMAFQGRNVSVNLFANASYLWERIEDLGGAPPLKVGESYTRYRNWVKEGFAPGAFFGPKVRNIEYPIDIDSDCEPESREELLAYFATPRSVTTTGPFRVLLENGDPRPCGGGQDFLGLYLGKPTPDWQGSFGGSISLFGNWEINSLFEYKAGNYKVHNLTYGFRTAHPALGGNLPGSVEARAILANPASTAEQRLEAAREWVTEYVALAPYDGLGEIEDADFVRWRELGVTYNVPGTFAQRVGANSMSITLTGRNLALWTKYNGPDPEVNLLGRTTGGGLDDMAMGIDAFGLPLPRRFTAAVRVGF